MSPPISTEFAASMKEMSLGSPIETALTNMVDRVGSEDLELVMTAVLIQRQIGGNLAEVLDNIAETIRERVKLRQEIKTLTAQGRLSGIIIGVLPIALAIFLLGVNPEYISILFTCLLYTSQACQGNRGGPYREDREPGGQAEAGQRGRVHSNEGP